MRRPATSDEELKAGLDAVGVGASSILSFMSEQVGPFTPVGDGVVQGVSTRPDRTFRSGCGGARHTMA